MVVSKCHPNFWTKRFQRNPHNSDIKNAIKSLMTPCLHRIDQVCSSWCDNRHTHAHSHTEWLPYPSRPHSRKKVLLLLSNRFRYFGICWSTSRSWEAVFSCHAYMTSCYGNQIWSLIWLGSQHKFWVMYLKAFSRYEKFCNTTFLSKNCPSHALIRANYNSLLMTWQMSDHTKGWSDITNCWPDNGWHM